MSSQSQLPSTSTQSDAASSIQRAIRKFHCVLAQRHSCRDWLSKMIRDYPGLFVATASLLMFVLFCKVMTVWSSFGDDAVGEWIHNRGGYCGVIDKAAPPSWLEEFFFFLPSRSSGQYDRISAVAVPASLVNDDEELFSQLSQLSQLKDLRISGYLHNGTESQKSPEAKPHVNTPIIDSERLQRGLESLPQPVVLTLENCRLTPCQHPRDLSHRIMRLNISGLVMDRDFARGLPIIKQGYSSIVNDVEIHDAAVAIYLERVSCVRMHLVNCSMSEEMYARLATTRGIHLTASHIIGTKPPIPMPPAAMPGPAEMPSNFGSKSPTYSSPASPGSSNASLSPAMGTAGGYRSRDPNASKPQ